MKIDLPQRKITRLREYDYSQPGAYFITLCTKGRAKILSSIDVGDGVLDVPKSTLTEYGKTADRYIRQMNGFYENISVDNHVIMPNHVHLLLTVSAEAPGRASPANSVIAGFVSTLKRFCNKEYGKNIWQRSSYDHVVRGDADYREIWNYIDTNVLRWSIDKFYTE